MTHLAVTEALDGKAVDWLEPVTDAQYPATTILEEIHDPRL
jgi:4-carboxymuconolactone decarboxylase